MSSNEGREPMLDMFIFETFQLIEQLELAILNSEKAQKFSEETVNEIFRIMHTIKGSSAMMLLNDISGLAHSIEDLFFYIRETKEICVDYSRLADIVLKFVDFIRYEVGKLDNGQDADGNSSDLTAEIKNYLYGIKGLENINDNANSSISEKVEEKEQQRYYIAKDKVQTKNKNNCNYHALVYFVDDCAMENIRAFTIIHNLKQIARNIEYYPEDIVENDDTDKIIREEGFNIIFESDKNIKELEDFFAKTIFLKELKLEHFDNNIEIHEVQNRLRAKASKGSLNTELSNINEGPNKESSNSNNNESSGTNKPGIDKQELYGHASQSMINVSVDKLDKLMDLVGELVISEAMVTQNPELKNLELDNFYKAARQLNKITSELQDIVMAIRMIPLTNTFQKMNRIVRDMSKKLEKEVELQLIGEETEVDKNIIEQISDPLMHLVRNAIDHGIESKAERILLNKNEKAKLTLEAKNAGGDVLISVKDDGNGLDKTKIYDKAKEHGIINKSIDEMSDKEIYSLILLPGFSTNEQVTEYSGRGVGMDVVSKNIDSIGGSILIESLQGYGTTITLKIPLTMAIIDGINISVGKARYTVPTPTIKEFFRVKEKDIITDPDGNEMIMVRGECYPILRLHSHFGVNTQIKKLQDGIIVMVESESRLLCLFCDFLLGEQEVVVKPLPKYIKKVKGVAGCTLLGDGSISLILDTAVLMNN
ncbi:chemotaxis protein CheW [Candidatus Clostridium stratigraminis]|uniref:Chemotaxis protein CheA n=1 Tax=Candidatus Clostridium stratigraminis TaxID=3381661 RepID=A0ABW8T653_9CLOT